MVLVTSEKEHEYRRKFLNGTKVLKEYPERLKCTKCSKDFIDSIEKGKDVLLHPLLSVFFCQNCTIFYLDGEFSSDEDGEDKYCRWCGEGGTLFLCSKCMCGFCPKCIKKNLGHKLVRDIKDDDDWSCFICVSQPLWELRAITHAAAKLAKENRRERESKLNRRKLKIAENEKLIESKCKILRMVWNTLQIRILYITKLRDACV